MTKRIFEKDDFASQYCFVLESSAEVEKVGRGVSKTTESYTVHVLSMIPRGESEI